MARPKTLAFSRERCTSYVRRDHSIKIKPAQDLGRFAGIKRGLPLNFAQFASNRRTCRDGGLDLVESRSRSLSENSSTSPHCPRAFAGLWPFGLSPALGAHYPLAHATAPRVRRQIFSRLCVRQISCHSAATFSNPRNRNPRMPRTPLIWPKTGSTIRFRAA